MYGRHVIGQRGTHGLRTGSQLVHDVSDANTCVPRKGTSVLYAGHGPILFHYSGVRVAYLTCDSAGSELLREGNRWAYCA